MSIKTYLVGRNPNVSQGEIAVKINDPSKKVSSNHCRITYDGANFFIEDLISTNGTYVNGIRISNKVLIDDQSKITLGKTFVFPLLQFINENQINQFQTQAPSEGVNVQAKSLNKTPLNKLMIGNSIANSLPAMVRNELAKMPSIKQEEFVEEYKRNTKSTGFAYLFLFFIFGMHYGYLKKWGLQFVFWFTGGGFLIWYFIDIFRLPSLVKNYNKDKAIEVMRNLQTTAQ